MTRLFRNAALNTVDWIFSYSLCFMVSIRQFIFRHFYLEGDSTFGQF